ncbi:MAG: DNA repair protein RecO [Bacteroidetes bacterium]|jgi:DNA repair protein RecO (recombination protein O)|nr:DNA repair protein RecO [Bacteroidota bacterium]
MTPEKSRGIVLQHIRFSDTSLIVKIFTEEFGVRSYLIKGAYQKHSKFRPAIFLPMSIIEFVQTSKIGKELHFMKEVSVNYHFHQLHQLVEKNAIVMFMSELLSRTIQEEEPNVTLFRFLYNSLLWLDLRPTAYSDFPLYLMIELSRYLGFYPKSSTFQPDYYFDLMAGIFKNNMPEHPYYLDKKLSAKLFQLSGTALDTLSNLAWSNADRRGLLQELINYYKLHIPGFQGLKSHEVLKTVLE